ncbi:MAG: PIG-L family deacetylase [Pirellulales bacterium]|nr:PIG-L family deacetylase [Pirellulales bacterium]
MPDLPEPLDVIAVGAHPDDVEIACGGTLARLVEQGRRVGIIDLTDGEPTPHSPGPEARLAEARAAAEALGVHHRITLNLSNRRLFDTFDSRVALAVELRRYRPRLVLGFGEKTPLASPDHWQAMQITDAAVFYARLTKWDEHFQHLPPHRIDAQLYFSLSFYSITPMQGAGHIVSEISSTLAKKLAAVRCYATQFPKEKEHVFERVESWARHLGQVAGFDAGELFISPRTLGARDLMGAIFGDVVVSPPPDAPL